MSHALLLDQVALTAMLGFHSSSGVDGYIVIPVSVRGTSTLLTICLAGRP